MTDMSDRKWPIYGLWDMEPDKSRVPWAARTVAGPEFRLLGCWPGQLPAQSSGTVPDFGNHHGAPIWIVDDHGGERRDADGAKNTTRGVQERCCNTKNPVNEHCIIQSVAMLVDGQQFGIKAPWISNGFGPVALQSDRCQRLITQRLRSVSQQGLSTRGRVQLGLDHSEMPECDRTVEGNGIDKGNRVSCKPPQVGTLARPEGKRLKARAGQMEKVLLAAARCNPRDHAISDAVCLCYGITRTAAPRHEGRHHAHGQGFIKFQMDGDIRQSGRSISINHIGKRPHASAKRANKSSSFALEFLSGYSFISIVFVLNQFHCAFFASNRGIFITNLEELSISKNINLVGIVFFQGDDLLFIVCLGDSKWWMRADPIFSRTSFKGE